MKVQNIALVLLSFIALLQVSYCVEEITLPTQHVRMGEEEFFKGSKYKNAEDYMRHKMMEKKAQAQARLLMVILTTVVTIIVYQKTKNTKLMLQAKGKAKQLAQKCAQTVKNLRRKKQNKEEVQDPVKIKSPKKKLTKTEKLTQKNK